MNKLTRFFAKKKDHQAIRQAVEQETLACLRIAEGHLCMYEKAEQTERAEAARYIANSIHARSGTL